MLYVNKSQLILNRKSPAEKQPFFSRSRLTAVLLIVFSFNTLAQSGAWVKKAQLPSPRAGASASVVNNRIYVIGVYYAVQDLGINDMYDPVTNTWETKKTMPTPRGFMATAVVNDTIYAIAGGNPYSPLKKVEAYDPLTDTWTSKADMPMPNAEMQADTVNGIIYVIGGAFEKRNCFAFDPAANKWTEKKPRPDKSGVMAVTSYNGLLYTFGGGQGPSGPAFSLVYAYDPKPDTWIKKKDMPTARFSFRTFLVNNKIYAVGGSRVSGNTLSAVEVYDPQTDTWEVKTDMPVPLCHFAGAVVNNKIYVIGGTSDWVIGKADVWEYDPFFQTDIKDEAVKKKEFSLEQNYPNPFNPATTIKFSLPYPAHVLLKIYDILGREVATLINEDKPAGNHSVNWKADNLSSGIYFYEIRAGNYLERKKMILLR